jgi:hypothetical protein
MKNAKEALKKIADLLNLTFKKETFASTKLVDGETEVTNNLDEDFKIGQTIYIVGESTLTPAPAGSHTTREGLVITLDSSSVIIAIESGEASEELGNIKMVEATDSEGQVLESNTFDVGEKVEVVNTDGTKTPVADGEHQVTLKDSEGNDVKIRFTTVDGIITERSNVEEMSIMEEEPMEDTPSIEDLLKILVPVVEEMKSIADKMKIANETMSAELTALKTDFDKFKKSPEKFSVAEKKTYKESATDYKLELIKSLRK